MSYQRDPEEVRRLMEEYTISDDEREHYGEEDQIRDDEIVQTCKHWLELSEVQRLVWLDKAKRATDDYRSHGDDRLDVEWAAYREATCWLRREWDYDLHDAVVI